MTDRILDDLRANRTVELLRCPECGAFDTDPPSEGDPCEFCEVNGGQLMMTTYSSPEAVTAARVEERERIAQEFVATGGDTLRQMMYEAMCAQLGEHGEWSYFTVHAIADALAAALRSSEGGNDEGT